MEKKTTVTLEDIAARLGVSGATVSQALSGKGRMTAATRERVLQMVEELAYHPDQTAQNLARRRASQVTNNRSKPKRWKGGGMPSSILMNLLDASEVKELVLMEIQQRDEEGYQVDQFRRPADDQDHWSKHHWYEVYRELLSSPQRDYYPYHEPETLDEIRAARPAGPRRARQVFTPASLYEHIYGGWLGRAIGCVLGKPIEAGWSKSKVVHYLKMSRSYPLANYIPRIVPNPPDFELNPESDGFFRGEIDGVPCDDDLDYSILSLHLLESYGIEFSTNQVATEWLGHLPYFRTYTAERIAYRNLTHNIMPPESATVLNPAREFIGARIRSDLYGMVAPGMPELAAGMAYRDATLSHTKNGVYSAMFQAAMLAWSFISKDPLEIIAVGLSEIPQTCRLAQAVRDVLDIHQERREWEIAYDQLILKYGDYHPVHAINNTMWVALALLYGEADFEKTICTAVTCGLDTDCNGANAGAILGVMHGSLEIPTKWTEPLHDTLYTSVSQWKERQISALARRTARLAEQTLLSYG